MSWERWVLAIFVAGLAALQYGLILVTLRDLLRRPTVRGENKVLWALVILCVPFVGPLIYGYMGPTSLLPRSIPRRPPRWFDQWRPPWNDRSR